MPYLDRTRNTAKREGAQRWAKAHLTPFPQTKGGNGKAMPFPQSIGNGTVPAVPPALRKWDGSDRPTRRLLVGGPWWPGTSASIAFNQRDAAFRM